MIIKLLRFLENNTFLDLKIIISLPFDFSLVVLFLMLIKLT